MTTKAAENAKANGDGTADPVQPEGVPVNGKLYTVDQLTGAEQRLLRTILREATGQEDAHLGDLLFPVVVDGVVLREPLAEFFDHCTGFRYVINRRSKDDYTLEQAGDFKPNEEWEKAIKLTEKKSAGRPTRAGSASES